MAKKNKNKDRILPKRIAGVKVPKALRKSGKSLLKMAETPVARQLIAAGLVAVAAAMTSSGEGQRKTGKARRKLGRWAGARSREVNEATQALGAAVTAAMEKWLGSPAKDEGAEKPAPTAH